MMPESTPISPEVPAEPAPLGFGGKLWNIFVNPQATFRSIRGGHQWIILWLIVTVVSLACYMPTRSIIRHDQLTRIEEQLSRNPQVSAEQREEILERVRGQFDNPLYMLFVPVTYLVMLVVVAGVLMFLGNIILGGNVCYLRMLNGYAWTMMIGVLAALVMLPLVMAKGSTDVSLGLGALAGAETGPFVKKVLSSFELFGLWQVWLSSLAVSVLAGVPAKKALVTVFLVWLVWVLIQGGLATLGISFGM